MSKKCQKCNTLNDNNSKFCIGCGEALVINNLQQNYQSNQPQQNYQPNQPQQNFQPNQYQQNYNQYQNPQPVNKSSSNGTIIIIIAVVILIGIVLSSLSAFILYLV